MSLRSNAKIVLTKSARLHVVIASVFLNAHLFSSDWDCPMSYNHPRLTSLLLLSPLQLMGERCWVFFVFFFSSDIFLKCPWEDERSAETGNPWSVLYENSSISQNLQRETEIISRGGSMRARTHIRSRTWACFSWRTLKRGKATPVWNISQQVCTRGQSSTHFYFFTCFLQLAGNFWSHGGVVWLCFRGC